jgi:hypothetical protein
MKRCAYHERLKGFTLLPVSITSQPALVAPPRFWQLLSPLDAPDLTGEGGAKKALPEKTKKMLLDPDTWKRDAGLFATTTKLREAWATDFSRTTTSSNSSRTTTLSVAG